MVGRDGDFYERFIAQVTSSSISHCYRCGEELHGDFYAALLDHQCRPTKPPPPHGFTNPGDPSARLAGIYQWLSEAPVGCRNSSLYWATCRVAEMYLSGEITNLHTALDTLTDIARQLGLPDSEIHGPRGTGGTIGSALHQYGLTA